MMMMMNVLGDMVLVTKRDQKAFEKHDSLPENLSRTMKSIRKLSRDDRLKRCKEMMFISRP